MTDVATKEKISSFYKAWTEHNVELCRKLVCLSCLCFYSKNGH